MASDRPKVGVGVALVWENQVLLGERLGSHGANSYAFPGGHLENSEEWAECAAREVAEETGLDLGAARYRFTGVTNDIMPPKRQGESNLHYVTIFMAADLSREEAEAVRNLEPHKCAGWQWIALEELETFRTSGVRFFTSLSNFINQGLHATLMQQSRSARQANVSNLIHCPDYDKIRS